jgi:DNA recombination protein RmuC
MTVWIILSILVVFIIFLTTIFIFFLGIKKQLNAIIQQVDTQLKDNTQALLTTHKTVGERMDNVAEVINKVHTSLGELTKTSEMIFGVGKDISSLQELLRAPKFRGEFSETLLENLLSQVLPREYFKLQYRFQNGTQVDAVIKLGENFVSVDAKFPLENFRMMLEAKDEILKKQYRKLFIRDIKKHIDEIAMKYILPDESTYDFALMYIPAENVYYETIIKDTEIMPYSISKKVIPVSPNTFYAYLEVICLGLRGMRIEKNAKEVMAKLAQLSLDIEKFKENFDLVGTHLANAKAKYEEAQVRLGKLSNKYQLISNSLDE